MKRMYAVETTIEENHPQIIEELSEFASVCAQTCGYFITEERHDAEVLQTYFTELNQFIDLHPVISCVLEKKTTLFSDYGVESEQSDYLFADEITIFSITEGEATQKEMATYQIEEDLIARLLFDYKTCYVIDCKMKSLINGYAEAYDIEVSFFQLDKLHKND